MSRPQALTDFLRLVEDYARLANTPGRAGAFAAVEKAASELFAELHDKTKLTDELHHRVATLREAFRQSEQRWLEGVPVVGPAQSERGASHGDLMAPSGAQLNWAAVEEAEKAQSTRQPGPTDGTY